MPNLIITDADFDNAITGLVRIQDGFANMKNVGGELAGAVGHQGLAGACTDFVSDWSVNRDRIKRAIDNQLNSLKAARQAFQDAEDQLGNGQGDGSQQPPQPSPPTPAPPAPTPPPSTGGGGSDGGVGGGGGGGVSTVSGSGSSPTLGGTKTEEAKGANAVTGGGGGAALGGTETKEAKPAHHVGGTGVEPDLGGALPEGHQDANKVGAAGTNADIVQQLKEKGLPVFEVDGQVQRPLGEVEGIGTLLGSQGNPPTISAVVDSKGNVVDIADLKPEYDEKGNLVALNQVPVPADTAGGTLAGAGSDTKQPGVVDGSATAAPTLDQRTQEAVAKVKELFGDMVDVAVSGGKNGSEPTLTVAGVSGIGLAALAALATMSRSGAAEGDSATTQTGDISGLRGALSGLAPEAKGGFEQRPATDRQNLIDNLLRDLSPEYVGDQPAAGADGAQLRDSLNQAVGADQEPLGEGSQKDSWQQADSGAQSLKDSLVGMEAAVGKADGLGPDLPPASGSVPGGGDLGGPLPAGSGGGDLGGPLPAGSGGDLGGPLPSGAGGGDLAGPPPSGTKSSDSAAQSAAPGGENGDAVTRERRNAHMMGGMGMAAGMSAAGGRAGMTGAEEARRNEEARRLRDRLANSKENN